MSTYAAAAPPVSGPSVERHAFLKRTAVWTLIGLLLAAVVGTVSMFTIARVVFQIPYGGIAVILGTFFFAHFVCRKMVYGSAAVPGFILACVAEGVAFGFLLLVTVANAGVAGGIAIVAEALFLTAATAGGMLVYVWFSKGELKVVRAFLTMAFVPMLILMAVSIFFPIGGTIGLVICALFVLVSAAGLLYRLNYVVHELDPDQHVVAAYEVTMGLLVLLWNLISLLNRLRR
jgi:FtsH-binding integral membrane protein